MHGSKWGTPRRRTCAGRLLDFRIAAKGRTTLIERVGRIINVGSEPACYIQWWWSETRRPCKTPSSYRTLITCQLKRTFALSGELPCYTGIISQSILRGASPRFCNKILQPKAVGSTPTPFLPGVPYQIVILPPRFTKVSNTPRIFPTFLIYYLSCCDHVAQGFYSLEMNTPRLLFA